MATIIPTSGSSPEVKQYKEEVIHHTYHPKGKLPNIGSTGSKAYYPANELPIGQPYPASEWKKNEPLPALFQPLKIRNATFKNRIWVAPMCQYSSVDGHTSDWHLVHLGAFAARGAGAITIEATAVSAEGRITPEDNGIWLDSHVPGLKRIVEFVHGQGGLIGIQLAHAGRKASTRAPWAQDDLKGNSRDDTGSEVATVEEGGWPDNVLSSSDVPHKDSFPKPKALDEAGIQKLIGDFVKAVERCKTIGFDYIEIHGAHGYLMHNFFSPLSNTRTDGYGGSFENRIRFTVEVSKAVRKAWGEEKPIFFRVSASDWAEELGEEKGPSGEWQWWGIEQTTLLAKKLHEEAGIDLIDASSGGLWYRQKIPVQPGYQVQFAEHLKKHVPASMLVGSVGLITEIKQAEEIVASGQADVVRLARELLRDVDFVLKAAQELGVAVQPAVQYARAWTRMLKE